MTLNTTNPLLDTSGLPRFAQISAEHVGPAVDALIAECEAALERATGPEVPADYDALSAVLDVATERLGRELAGRGIAQARPWGRGIDHWLFRPLGDTHPMVASLPRPILLNVGRVAPEKNLPAFLEADVPGTKVVVGPKNPWGAWMLTIDGRHYDQRGAYYEPVKY